MKFIIIFSLLLLVSYSESQLYNKYDNVVIFNTTSFEETFNKLPDDNWFIHFYHSYCGHCINLAPKYKVFLREAKNWNWIIKFGVIDCSVEKELCRFQSVKFYPYFKLYLNKSDDRAVLKGISKFIGRTTIKDIFANIIKVIDSYFKPTPLIEYKSNTDSLKTPYIFLTGGNSIDLKRAILSYYSRLKYDLYYRVTKGITTFNFKFAMENQVIEIEYSYLNRLYNGLDNYLADHFKANESEIIQFESTEAPIPNVSNSSIVYPIYNQDIYASVLYALTSDVNDDKLIVIDYVNILRNFVEQISKFSGFNDNLLEKFKLLTKLIDMRIDYLKDKNEFRKSWPTIIDLVEFPTLKSSWIGCLGSKPYFRRYPCGLWTTFHSLTVNQYVKTFFRKNTKDIAINLVKAIREFIITFFSCHECAVNFEKETADYQSQINNTKDAVLYIWKVHNSVNKRLARTASEDPKFPKVAFPPVSVCPKCRTSSNLIWPEDHQWRKEAVFEYLTKRFFFVNVIHRKPHKTNSSRL